LLEYVDEVDDVMLMPHYYACLKILMNRGEFSLSSLGFTDRQKKFLEKSAEQTTIATGSSKELKLVQLKLNVGYEYQKLIYAILRKVLEKLNYKAPTEAERDFL
jgi:hypothetical protein